MKKILLKGACDIDALNFYLKPSRGIVLSKEGGFETEKHGFFYCTSNSEILLHLNEEFDSKFQDNLFYKSLLFENNFDLIVLSTITEYCYGIYRNKKTGVKTIYGERGFNAFENPEKYINKELYFGFGELTLSDYIDLSNEWEYVGLDDISVIIQNYKTFVSKLNPDTKVAFLLGPTVHDEEKEISRPFIGANDFFEKLNKAMVDEFSSYNNVYLLDVNKYLAKHVKSEYFFYNFPSIVHYKRKVYFEIAKELASVYPSYIKATYNRERKRRFKKIVKKLIGRN